MNKSSENWEWGEKRSGEGEKKGLVGRRREAARVDGKVGAGGGPTDLNACDGGDAPRSPEFRNPDRPNAEGGALTEEKAP